VVVVVLLVTIWGAVLVPPVVRSQRSRRTAFEVSFGRGPSPVPDAVPTAPRRHSSAVQRRRRIAGGLLTAMVATGLSGMLTMSRPLLVVHLFMVDSFLFYVALLAHRADQRATAKPPGVTAAEIVTLDRRRVPRARRRAAALTDLAPVAPAG